MDLVSHVHLRDIQFNRQSTRIFHGIEENGSDFSSQTDSVRLDVWHIGNFISHEMQDRIGGGFSGRTRSDHIADIGQRKSFLVLQLLNLSQRSNFSIHFGQDTFASIFQHGQSMKGRRIFVATREAAIFLGCVFLSSGFNL